MAHFEHTWQALLQPGLATTYFAAYHHQQFQTDVSSYSQVNAWWLAELCRLIYKQDSEEIGDKAQPPTRQRILQNIGLHEIAFFNTAGTQGALIAPASANHNDFAILVFRGTHALNDWIDNLKALALPNFQPERWPGGGRVHIGFREALDRVWDDIEPRLMNTPGPLFYTGHSLGAALATLAASRRPPSALYTFGSPRVGDQQFAVTLTNCPTFRVVNNRDIVTALPPPLRGFCHVGEVHYIAHDGRMLTNPPQEIMEADRQLYDPTFARHRNWWDRLVGPPQFLADHAPVNYVGHLERALTQA